jgi:hypothetical protein
MVRRKGAGHHPKNEELHDSSQPLKLRLTGEPHLCKAIKADSNLRI